MIDGAIIYEGVIIALIVIAGLSPLLSRFYMERRWIPERGTVVGNTVEIEADGGQSYWIPQVEFFVQGKSHTFLGLPSAADKSPRFKVGHTVDILYKPSNPSRAIFRVWRPYFVNAMITGGCALVLLVPYAFARFTH